MTRGLVSSLAAMTFATALLLGGCSPQKDAAKTRVENVLNGLTRDDQSNGYQTAICQWFDGSYTMSQSDLESALNHFETWTKQKSLKKPIESYSVDKVTIQADSAISTALVEVTIDGASYKIKVVKEQPMQWQ